MKNKKDTRHRRQIAKWKMGGVSPSLLLITIKYQS